MLTPHQITQGPLIPRPPHPWGRFVKVCAATLFLIGVSGVILWKFHRPILTRYALLFRVDNPVPSDAIVMLLGGLESRPEKAAALYRAGIASNVILCTGPPPYPGFSAEWDASIRRMLSNQVPLNRITVVNKPTMSTWDEARAILPVAQERGWKSLTVVTTSFHTRRSQYTFNRVFKGSGIEIHVAAATDPSFDETNWFERDESAIVYVNETLKTLYYWVRY